MCFEIRNGNPLVTSVEVIVSFGETSVQMTEAVRKAKEQLEQSRRLLAEFEHFQLKRQK